MKQHEAVVLADLGGDGFAQIDEFLMLLAAFP
jgi:hypothetical protein